MRTWSQPGGTTTLPAVIPSAAEGSRCCLTHHAAPGNSNETSAEKFSDAHNLLARTAPQQTAHADLHWYGITVIPSAFSVQCPRKTLVRAEESCLRKPSPGLPTGARMFRPSLPTPDA